MKMQAVLEGEGMLILEGQQWLLVKSVYGAYCKNDKKSQNIFSILQ
jgi:hypothetical protein